MQEAAQTKQGRRNLMIPDDLWRRVQRAAADETARRGYTVSISQWIRETLADRLEHHATREPLPPR